MLNNRSFPWSTVAVVAPLMYVPLPLISYSVCTVEQSNAFTFISIITVHPSEDSNI